MIESFQANFARDRDALLGLMYIAGKNQVSHLNIHDLWKADESETEHFRLVMSV